MAVVLIANFCSNFLLKMAFASCFIQVQMPLKVELSGVNCRVSCSRGASRISILPFRSVKSSPFGRPSEQLGTKLCTEWSLLAVTQPSLRRAVSSGRNCRIFAECLPSPEHVTNTFVVASSAVVPFYGLMVAAPKAEFTKKLMESSIPYTVLGLLYAYFLYLSWRPDTLSLLFSSELGQPELPSIAKLFSRELTVASAWVHILVVDLFAARHVLGDGLKNNVETRHSVLLCLLFGPMGILSHFVTKALTKKLKQIQ